MLRSLAYVFMRFLSHTNSDRVIYLRRHAECFRVFSFSSILSLSIFFRIWLLPFINTINYRIHTTYTSHKHIYYSFLLFGFSTIVVFLFFVFVFVYVFYVFVLVSWESVCRHRSIYLFRILTAHHCRFVFSLPMLIELVTQKSRSFPIH